LTALPVVPNVVKIQLRGTLGDDTNIQNTLHCSFTGSPTVADCNNWALAVSNAWVSDLAPYISLSYVLNDVIVTDLTSSTSSVGSDIANHAGTNSASSSPAGVAMVIRMEISRRYRGGHPRLYLAGIPYTDIVSENQWSAATINNIEAGFTLFTTAIQAFSSSTVQGKSIVNVSYVDGHTWVQESNGNWIRKPVYRAQGITDVVSSYIVNPVCASQRRRNLQP
jgi:prepilin-type processing-associated H-X9-DG protein